MTEALADLEIGFLVYCAGADADYAALLDNPVSTAESLIHRNCTVLVQLCHAFAGPMVERGRGGTCQRTELHVTGGVEYAAAHDIPGGGTESEWRAGDRAVSQW